MSWIRSPVSAAVSVGDKWPSLMPGLFVLLWGSGFIGAKYGLPYCEPFTFLLVRFLIVTAMLLTVVLITRAPWPRGWRQILQIAVAGLLIHATYLGGVFNSLYWGVPAGISALIVSLQPLLTAVLVGPFLGERLTLRQWVGFLLGIGGVALVVYRKLGFHGADLAGLIWSIIALLGITGGTLFQKKYCSAMDLQTGTTIQYGATALAMLIIAPLTEGMEIHWTGEFLFALAWLSLVLSLGAVFLLFMLIRRGDAARVVSLFYLVPPVTALMAYLLFHESLGALAFLGMGVATAGVALVHK